MLCSMPPELVNFTLIELPNYHHTTSYFSNLRVNNMKCYVKSKLNMHNLIWNVNINPTLTISIILTQIFEFIILQYWLGTTCMFNIILLETSWGHHKVSQGVIFETNGQPLKEVFKAIKNS
jgi:hypothetical protein